MMAKKFHIPFDASGSAAPAWLTLLEPYCSEPSESERREITDPAIAPKRFAWLRRKRLGERVAKIPRVYLDQRYWIFCRDASLGRAVKAVHVELLRLLRAGVRGGTFICPASFPILYEVLKIGDGDRRNATTAIIDELSTGAALQRQAYLVQAETYNFLHTYSNGKGEHRPLIERVWTFPSLIHGDVFPHLSSVDDQTNDILKKHFIHMMSSLPLSVTASAMAAEGMLTKDSPAHVDELNAATREFQHEVTSYKTVFASEIAGILDACDEDLFSALGTFFQSQTGRSLPTRESDEGREAMRMFRNVIYNASTLGKLKVQLPFLFIAASIHAAIRHRQQPYRCGDQWDHMHAHAGLAYCKTFFTERSLGNLITSKPAGLASEFGVAVLWDEDDAVSYLKQEFELS